MSGKTPVKNGIPVFFRNVVLLRSSTFLEESAGTGARPLRPPLGNAGGPMRSFQDFQVVPRNLCFSGRSKGPRTALHFSSRVRQCRDPMRGGEIPDLRKCHPSAEKWAGISKFLHKADLSALRCRRSFRLHWRSFRHRRRNFRHEPAELPLRAHHALARFTHWTSPQCSGTRAHTIVSFREIYYAGRNPSARALSRARARRHR